MNKYLTIILIIIFIIKLYSNIYANFLTNDNILYYCNYFLFYNYLSFDQDSLNNNKTSFKDSNNFIPVEEFMYADTRLASINGELPYKNTLIRPVPATIVGVTYTGLFLGQHFIQNSTIWKDKGSFRIIEDGKYALYVDKPGHIWGTYFVSYLGRDAFVVSGINWELSNILGAALGLAYTSYIEILDGFGVNWGFSPSDFYADVGGSVFFLAQHYIPFLQNFTPKACYYPANWYGELPRTGSETFNDDYSSQTFWLSINVYNLLPDNLKKYWPSWLELSLGYTARNICDPQNYVCDPNRGKMFYDENGNPMVFGSPRFIIALDYNLVKLLPDGGSFWNWLKQTLNFWKFPSPAIEIGEKVRFFLLYPFKFNIGDIRF